MVKGGDKISAPFIFVSESEVDLNDENIKKVLEKLGLDYVLNNLWGFDNTIVYESTGTFYEVDSCKHRGRTGNIIDGVRYSGRERLDDEWIDYGNPSEDAKMAARQDITYLQEIANLSKRAVSY